MIVRTWRGATAAADADEYVAYMNRTGLAEYRATPGCVGAFTLCRPRGERMEFLFLSFWESEAAVRAFAGEDMSRARFYPEDARFLVEAAAT